MNTDNTARIGVNATERIFLGYGWAFRSKEVSDYGIDAEVEVVTATGQAEGQLLALQIKSGTSYFQRRGEGFVYRSTNARHLEYWSKYWLPVFIILHNPETQETLWREFKASEVEITDAGWLIEIPRDNILDAATKAQFEQIIANIELERQRARDVARPINPSNNEVLDAIIDGLAQDDREMRIRILGYSLWFSPLAKEELLGYLGRYHAAPLIEGNARRLCDGDLLKDTGNYFLPNLDNATSRKACEEAMAHVEAEIIQYVVGTEQ